MNSQTAALVLPVTSCDSLVLTEIRNHAKKDAVNFKSPRVKHPILAGHSWLSHLPRLTT